jgi:chitosanase
LVNVFETGSARGNYGDVTVIQGDAGHLTYGRSQTTLASGGLHALISAYCLAAGATEAAALEPYLARLAARDTTLDGDAALKSALRRAGSDPVMQVAQDAYFDDHYWGPALRAAVALGIECSLGVAVVYDSHIHGSWALVRDKTIARHGTPSTIGEHVWIARYVETRRAWLGNHAITVLHKSVRRMDAFMGLIDAGNWDLGLPFTVRGVLISEAVLDGEAPPPTLMLGARGDEVRRLQRMLIEMGWTLEDDGYFGPATLAAVREYQERRGLKADGWVGAATWAALDSEVLG